MAEFYISLSSDEIAAQIAGLLNIQNKLYKHHSKYTIKRSAADYFVEVERNRVIGCVALLKEYPTMSKCYHMSIAPDRMRKGIASKLLSTAMVNCQTEYIYGTIREDNVASLNLVKKLGWQFIRKDWHRDHNVITVAKRLLM